MNEQWGDMLARWAIPEELVAQAPASPYFFDPAVFVAAADEALARDADTPSDVVAREALPPDGTVLDVGCGAGAASLRLAPARIVGVDPNAVLLDALAERAAHLGIEAQTVEGVWPEVADRSPVADVVVCHHVAYNVTDLAGFVQALTEHARHRIVLELTAVHPMKWMEPYWEAMYGLAQPDQPTADDAVALIASLDLHVHQQRWQRAYQMIGETSDEALVRIARRLCLAPTRLDELRDAVRATPPPDRREVVTLWW